MCVCGGGAWIRESPVFTWWLSVTEKPGLTYPVNEFSLAWSHDPGSFGVLTCEVVARWRFLLSPAHWFLLIIPLFLFSIIKPKFIKLEEDKWHPIICQSFLQADCDWLTAHYAPDWAGSWTDRFAVGKRGRVIGRSRRLEYKWASFGFRWIICNIDIANQKWNKG